MSIGVGIFLFAIFVVLPFTLFSLEINEKDREIERLKKEVEELKEQGIKDKFQECELYLKKYGEVNCMKIRESYIIKYCNNFGNEDSVIGTTLDDAINNLHSRVNLYKSYEGLPEVIDLNHLRK